MQGLCKVLLGLVKLVLTEVRLAPAEQGLGVRGLDLEHLRGILQGSSPILVLEVAHSEVVVAGNDDGLAHSFLGLGHFLSPPAPGVPHELQNLQLGLVETLHVQQCLER